jgi:hypothetical protein
LPKQALAEWVKRTDLRQRKTRSRFFSTLTILLSLVVVVVTPFAAAAAALAVCVLGRFRPQLARL